MGQWPMASDTQTVAHLMKTAGYQGGKQAVRYENWKGIRLGVNENRQAPLELYNLSTDLGERLNVSDRYPEVVTRIEGCRKPMSLQPMLHWI